MDKTGNRNENRTRSSRERLGAAEVPIVSGAIRNGDLSLNSLYKYVVRTTPEQPVQQFQSVNGERTYNFAPYNATPVDHRPETSAAYQTPQSAQTDPIEQWVRQFQQPEAAGQPQSQDDFALWRQQEMDSPGIDLQAPEIYTTPAYLNEDALARARNAVAGAYDAPEEGTR